MTSINSDTTLMDGMAAYYNSDFTVPNVERQPQPMVNLKPTQKKILDYMIQYFNEYKNIPLTSEIVQATHLSRGTVLKVQRKLHQLGFIDRFLVGKRMIIMILWKP